MAGDRRTAGRRTARAAGRPRIWPLRWIIEAILYVDRRVAGRTFAWISKHRRTTRDYERLPASREVMILWAMIALMTRCLAATAH